MNSERSWIAGLSLGQKANGGVRRGKRSRRGFCAGAMPTPWALAIAREIVELALRLALPGTSMYSRANHTATAFPPGQPHAALSDGCAKSSGLGACGK